MYGEIKEEDHTKQMQNNELTNEDIYNGGGHEVAPYGDMMLTGCFGILVGLDII